MFCVGKKTLEVQKLIFSLMKDLHRLDNNLFEMFTVHLYYTHSQFKHIFKKVEIMNLTGGNLISFNLICQQ